jgi:cytochrome P450
MNDTEDLIKAARSTTDDGPHTLVHEIIQSKLPPTEKSLHRVFDEVSTVTGAGFETTAAVIRLAVFHIYKDPRILQRLRAELATTLTNHDLKTFEQLPLMTAIIMEAMRLAPALATRSARIARDRDMIYKDWHIPAGTPVGMTIYLVHQNEEDYPEPKRFNPDRWMDPDPWQLGEKTFIPFAKGKRMCLGMQ